MVRFSKKTDVRQQRLPLFLIPHAPKKWQSYLKKQKQKRWIKNLVIVLGVVFVLGLIISVFRLGWWLGQPLQQAQFTKMESPRWSGRQQINLLIMISGEKTEDGGQKTDIRWQRTEDGSDEVAKVFAANDRFLIGSLNSNEGTLKVLSISTDLKIPDTKGTYTLLELLKLAAVQNPPQGMDFVSKSLSKYLAIPIDGYMVVSASIFNSAELEEIITQFHGGLQSPLAFLKIPVLINFIKNNSSTNLTPGQAFKGIWEVRGVRFDKLNFYELPDGLVESERDVFIKDIFEDPQIVKERLKISVKNASEVFGLATQTARAIENIGGEVIEIENSKLKTQNSKLTVFNAPKNSSTVKRLEDILGISAEWVKVEEAQRADVEVVVTN